MNQGMMSRFQTHFPPMYRENAGFKHSLSAFVRRIWILAICSLAFVLVAKIIFFIVPSSISSANDWFRIVSRTVLIGFLAWISWCGLAFLRHLNENLKLMSETRGIDEEAELREFTELAATIVAASSMVTSTRPKMIHFELEPIIQVARQIQKQEQRQFSEPGFLETRKVRMDSFVTACDIYNLFAANGYVLISAGAISEDQIDSISRKIARNICDTTAMSNSLGARVFSQRRVAQIVSKSDVDLTLSENDNDWETTLRNLIRWLASANIGIAVQHISATTPIQIKTDDKSDA